ncbi:hypothetical protein K0M31_012237 [Melipona bicolor]|uniref:Uncharacterized protein n=1 Tax=Melipona bicolor TaxID=60889 RepID=A0AA40FL19_9HYME|nr:hypothetical protein K0M31_012237 [Melipona bicolor]
MALAREATLRPCVINLWLQLTPVIDVTSKVCASVSAVQNERQPRNTATIRPEALVEMDQERALREAAVAVGVFGSRSAWRVASALAHDGENYAAVQQKIKRANNVVASLALIVVAPDESPIIDRRALAVTFNPPPHH